MDAQEGHLGVHRCEAGGPAEARSSCVLSPAGCPMHLLGLGRGELMRSHYLSGMMGDPVPFFPKRPGLSPFGVCCSSLCKACPLSLGCTRRCPIPWHSLQSHLGGW